MRKIVLGCLFVCGSTFGFAQQKHAVYDLQCDLQIVGTTQAVNFICLLPKHILGAQRVDSLYFSHQPDDIYYKEDNIYAIFKRKKPMEDINIHVKAFVTLMNSDLSSRSMRLDTADLTRYTQSEQFIESDAPGIIALSQKLKRRTRKETVQKIYNYVANNVKYSMYNPGDVGALATLELMSGDCTEFADLFVALCRASGIPARVVEGMLVNASSDGKHNWAEVYLEESGWVTFDPTKLSPNKLKNEYLQLTYNRTNKELKNSHFWFYNYFGDFVDIKEIIKASYLSP